MDHPPTERLGRRGAVASPDQLATQAGMEALRSGGSAADAAIAANAVLAVTFQHQCGLGGDLMALVRTSDGLVVGVESAGPAGTFAVPRRPAAGRHTRLSPSDPSVVTLPGCLDGWILLHEHFGRLEWSRLFDDAEELASGGFALSRQLADDLALLGDDSLVHEWLVGEPPRTTADSTAQFVAGMEVRSPMLAETLHQLAEAPRRSPLFSGPAGRSLLDMEGSPFAPSDLDQPVARIVPPVNLRALGAELFTLPPVSQGYLTLASCSLLDRLGLASRSPDDPEALSLALESWILLGQDRARRLSDGFSARSALEPAYLDLLAEELRAAPDLASLLASAERHRASWPAPAPTSGQDTIAIVAADASGSVAVVVQSLGSRFGARRRWPGTGILLHSRGMGFSADPTHPAFLAPGRRPPHTLSPTLAVLPPPSREAAPEWIALGTMGADSQPQILTQLLWRLLGTPSPSSPSEALFAGRASVAPAEEPPHPASSGFWTWEAAGLAVDLEADGGVPSPRAERLLARGHRVHHFPGSSPRFGHAQVVARRHGGTLEAASDPRSPAGAALAW
jgi:gamma-glutamyltranspeptidase/glutathione hydrolase